ncbi:Adenosine deaminase [Porphyromonas levii]|nr:Adenosine deaminase [Porphyromonas levii]
MTSVFRHILSDKESLSDYRIGRFPEFEDIKRRLLLEVRKGNIYTPDHYYLASMDVEFEGIDNLDKFLRLGLSRLAKEHLTLKGDRIFVIPNKYNSWIDLITYIPPLILQMIFLHTERPLGRFCCGDARREYFKDYICPNTMFTSLPRVDIPQLNAFVEKHKGLHDLHIHLNGSVETDNVWQDMLSQPDKVYRELKENSNYEKEDLLREQLEQEYHLIDPEDFRNLLFKARSLREYFFWCIFSPNKSSCRCNHEKNYPSFCHPFADLIGDNAKKGSQVPIEGLMYLSIFDYMAGVEKPSIELVHKFHFYLLILGLAHRLMTQQRHQYGFRQFQKITMNELRSYSEKEFKPRFHQLHGNTSQNICYLEGRFSPKRGDVENVKYICKINKGWDDFTNSLMRSRSNGKDSITDQPQLALIAHFIKKPDKDKNTYIRHEELRYDVWEKAKAIAIVKDRHYSKFKNLVGIDAASSELDAPPEVFAPAYRYLRRHGFNHFTYHAGEDFYHILGGLRAIYEAIVFTGLQRGDRIGHAVAAGVSPKVWSENIQGRLTIKKGEYLDDLIFAHHLIKERNHIALEAKVPLLTDKIRELCFDVYNESYPVHILEEAWLFRRFCPSALHDILFDSRSRHHRYGNAEYHDIIKANKGVLINKYDRKIEILIKYHSQEYRKEYDKLINIRTDELFSFEEINQLQLLILKCMAEREIVIETLPTSNMRIGHHSSYKMYHLWNWLKWGKEGRAIPPIVLGSDDPGIFMTSIFHEYASIYCCMVYEMEIWPADAMEVIRSLEANSRIYKFL